MTREEVYTECLSKIGKSNCLLLELATGFGKTLTAIRLVNHLVHTKYEGKHTSMLLLVAKTVHKQTWQDEFLKWGGINVDDVTIECYESLKNHKHEHFDIVVMDEVHHINSDTRLELLGTLSFDYLIGLSATIPKSLKQYFLYKYHAEIVSCDIADAIEDDVLPEPKIILYPLQLDNVHPTETIELNPRNKGMVYHGTYPKIWTYRKMKVHAFISCTQRQKLTDMDSQIFYLKGVFMRNHQEYSKNRWLFSCGERIKYLANLKNNVVLSILSLLKDERTITFCKTIEQAECLGKHCIHSKNKDSNLVYDAFNAKQINHITSVNVLNEGANLVDCKYAVFANYSSSEAVGPQRLGRSLRHKSPVIIMPYYVDTREQEIVEEMLKPFNKDSINIAYSMSDLRKFLQKE